MPVTARDAAISVLSAYRKNGARPDKIFGTVVQKGEMPERETALALRIIGGVLQNMMLLDFYIGAFSSMPVKKLQPQALDLLRIGVYQLVFLTKIPHSAAINEAVATAKKRLNPRAAGFINALLRRVSESAKNNSLPKVEGNNGAERLSILYSHPLWITETIIETLGMKGAEAFFVENNNPDTPVTIQVNTLKKTAADLVAELTVAGISAKLHAFLPDCIELYGAGAIDRMDAFKKGEFYVQDAAARMAVMIAGAKPGDFVIDGCAAPGGKSFAAAVMMHNSGRIISCDKHEWKMPLINEGAKRLGISIIKTRTTDAAIFNKKFAKSADVVIADVPCSGFGVIRRKPEIRYKSREEIKKLPDLQFQILSNLSRYVKPGGVIVYSTCTVLTDENELVINRFLQGAPDFNIESFINAVDGKSVDMLTLWPQTGGTDGFFICKLRREVSV